MAADRTARPDRSLPLAGGLLVGAGLLDVLSGIGDLGHDPYVSLHANGLLVYDITGWAWVHLAGGVLLVAAGLLVAFRRPRAGPVALAVVVASVVVHLLFAPYHLIHAVIVIGLMLAAARLVVRHRRGAGSVRTARRPSR